MTATKVPSPPSTGFDEFFGYLYHLDASWKRSVPPQLSAENFLNVVRPPGTCFIAGPRTRTTRLEMPTRWGTVGKQKIEERWTVAAVHPIDGVKYNMETVDDSIRDFALAFMDKSKADGKPFFVWINPTRMHVTTHLSPKYQALMNSDNGWSLEEAGMAQLDDDIGLIMQHLKDMGVDDNTIVVFTTDNGTEVFTWPDGGQTPFAQAKGTVMEGGFRVPCIMLAWPGHVPGGLGAEWHFLRHGLVPDFP